MFPRQPLLSEQSSAWCHPKPTAWLILSIQSTEDCKRHQITVRLARIRNAWSILKLQSATSCHFAITAFPAAFRWSRRRCLVLAISIYGKLMAMLRAPVCITKSTCLQDSMFGGTRCPKHNQIFSQPSLHESAQSSFNNIRQKCVNSMFVMNICYCHQKAFCCNAGLVALQGREGNESQHDHSTSTSFAGWN